MIDKISCSLDEAEGSRRLGADFSFNSDFLVGDSDVSSIGGISFELCIVGSVMEVCELGAEDEGGMENLILERRVSEAEKEILLNTLNYPKFTQNFVHVC